MRMTLPDGQTRDAMLDSDMAEGMERSYERMERVLAAAGS